ncbi:hydrophobic surface binding protein [Mycena albidolilacea]|uniref:Hydrophobic surface binding protein n=1 Tax=Mycena albidolilacea TaxID=1033008 RepID=A0AAD7ALI7_9AGAR|nr:hydrophobic surface binding protein [Mycena albidolilacea]
MVQITRFLTVLSVAAAGLALTVKRDAATVEADIAKISTQVTTLDNAIEAYPLTGGTLLNALTIHTDATTLITTLNGAVTDVTATSQLSEADGRTILSSVEAIEPTILDALTNIVVKKPAFAALPIGGLPALILQDLKNLKTATVAFANGLVSIAPADLVAEATQLSSNITAAFDPAIAAYS